MSSSYPPNASAPHFDSRSVGYPSVQSTLSRIRKLLGRTSPELLDTLNSPLSALEIAGLANELGLSALPKDVRDYLALHDGQDSYSVNAGWSSASTAAMGLVWGLWAMSSEEIVQDWLFWRTLDHEGHVPGMSSCPEEWVRKAYSSRGWIPLLRDGNGNYIGIDLDPPPNHSHESHSWDAVKAQVGQVIAFGREIDEKVVIFPGWSNQGVGGWARFLSSFADDLESQSFATLSTRAVSRAHYDQENGNASEHYDDEDGIGEANYYSSMPMGLQEANDESETPVWRLHKRWRGKNIIEALCARSKERWAEVGLYSTPAPSTHLMNGMEALGISSPATSDTPKVSDSRPLIEPIVSPPPQDDSSTQSLVIDTDKLQSRRESQQGLSAKQDFEMILTPPASSTSSFVNVSNQNSPIRKFEDRMQPPSRPTSREASQRQKAPPARIRKPIPPPAPLDLPTLADLHDPTTPNDSPVNGTTRFAHSPLATSSPINSLSRISLSKMSREGSQSEADLEEGRAASTRSNTPTPLTPNEQSRLNHERA